MNGYLLDTAVLTAYLRGRAGAVTLVSPWIVQQLASTSILVYGECIERTRSFADPGRWQADLRQLLQTIHPFDVNYAILERYADLRRLLCPTGCLIGDMDTLIAATAIEHDLTLVTIDSDFTRVPGLTLHFLQRSALL